MPCQARTASTGALQVHYVLFLRADFDLKRGCQHRLQQGVYRVQSDLSFCSLEVGV